jgi:hypothetical protein
MQARMLQYRMTTERKRLPDGWIRDWNWEHRSDGRNGAGVVEGGRRHAIAVKNGRKQFMRIIRVESTLEPRFRWQLNAMFPEIKWHPLSVPAYVFSNLDNFTVDVYDDDAPLILFGCYGEFVDVTTHWIKDDEAVHYTSRLVGTKPAQAANAGSTGLVGIGR